MSTRYYADVFNILDDIFSDAFDPKSIQPMRFNRAIATADWPPANLLIDNTTKQLTIEVALAGVKEDQIMLEFDGDHLKLTVDTGLNQTVKPGDKVTGTILQKGLRFVDHAEVKWAIDPRYYDRENVSTSYENGLLTIKINPREEVAPKRIPLFGKLPGKAIEE